MLRENKGYVPLWKAAIVTVGLCVMTHAYAYSTRPTIQIERIRYVDRPYTVEYQKVVRETFPVPVCGPLPIRTKRNIKTIDTLAAAIPASALGRKQ